MSKAKPTVLFVGGFKAVSGDGSYGGQVYACRALIHSKLKDKVDFILLDTTSESVTLPSVLTRSAKAAVRLLKLIWYLVFNQIDTVLVFSSSGFSFYEKGLMIRLGKLFGKQTIFAPRSGLIMTQLKNNSNMRHFGNTVFRASDYVICQGLYWKNFFAELYPDQQQKMWVQSNWIDLSSYPLKAPQHTNARLQLLFIGQFHPYKGIQDLLEAMQLLKQQPVDLTIYGGGDTRSAYEEFVHQAGLGQQVFFKGWANQEVKLRALAEADVLVIPSHVEGMPNVMLEAIASGVLVLATQVGGIPEIIQDKVTGILVKPSQPQELAAAVEWILSNRHQVEGMREKAYKKITAECSLETVADKFQEKFLSTPPN
jgi:glycosyltransferase involved in cell wall biosynthesis